MPEFNVFFSYSRKDIDAVTRIADALRQNNIRVWMDTTELIPGRPWKAPIAEALANSGSIAVFIGPDGLGTVENTELDIAIDEQISRNCPLIPVLLPGVPTDVKLPTFLHSFVRRNNWVNFDHGPQDREALLRLVWGITGEKPEQLRVSESQRSAASPAPATTGLDTVVNRLARALLQKGTNITFFIGPGANQGGCDLPPTADEMSTALLQTMSVLQSSDQPQPFVPIDIASSYYALSKDSFDLETRIVDLIRSRSRKIPQTHSALVDLLAALAARPPRRILGTPQQVIVTTNLDLMMERALLQAGISFTRIVQHCSLSQLDVNCYEIRRDHDYLVLGDGSRFARDDLETLDELIEVQGHEVIEFGQAERRPIDLRTDKVDAQSQPLGPVGRCILYKFHGSQDVSNSCALSTDHHFELAWRTIWKGYTPREVINQIRNTPLLFLGYTFIDPGFRLISHTLLHDRIAGLNPSYSVQLPPCGEDATLGQRIENVIWRKINDIATAKGVTIVEGRGEDFLRRLTAEVTTMLRAPS